MSTFTLARTDMWINCRSVVNHNCSASLIRLSPGHVPQSAIRFIENDKILDRGHRLHAIKSAVVLYIGTDTLGIVNDYVDAGFGVGDIIEDKRAFYYDFASWHTRNTKRMQSRENLSSDDLTASMFFSVVADITLDIVLSLFVPRAVSTGSEFIGMLARVFKRKFDHGQCLMKGLCIVCEQKKGLLCVWPNERRVTLKGRVVKKQPNLNVIPVCGTSTEEARHACRDIVAHAFEIPVEYILHPHLSVKRKRNRTKASEGKEPRKRAKVIKSTGADEKKQVESGIAPEETFRVKFKNEYEGKEGITEDGFVAVHDIFGTGYTDEQTSREEWRTGLKARVRKLKQSEQKARAVDCENEATVTETETETDNEAVGLEKHE